MRRSKDETRAKTARTLSNTMKRLVVGFRTLLEKGLQAEGLTLAQLRMLHALHEQPNGSAADLARTCSITPQSMQAVVKRAEAAKWIRRAASPENRRVLLASLTPLGEQVLARGMAIVDRMQVELWRDARLSELEAVNEMLALGLQRIENRLQAHHANADETA